MTEEHNNKLELIPCACRECNELILNYCVERDKNGNIRVRYDKPKKFNVGHNARGLNNSRWKGDNVGYIPLHLYIKKRLKKPDLCQFCGLVPPQDLANLTGLYNRDLDNWAYLCKKCHRNYDLREKHDEIDKRVCLLCPVTETALNQYGSQCWSKHEDGFICKSCYDKIRYQKIKSNRF